MSDYLNASVRESCCLLENNHHVPLGNSQQIPNSAYIFKCTLEDDKWRVVFHVVDAVMICIRVTSLEEYSDRELKKVLQVMTLTLDNFATTMTRRSRITASCLKVNRIHTQLER